MKHPADTALVNHEREVGTLVGNGSHCDYFVGELRTYAGSKQSVLRFYEDRTLWNPISGGRQDLEVAFIDNGKVIWPADLEMPDPVSDMARSLKLKHDRRSCYVVYILDSGYGCGLDVRCL
jgi:hypothetical protein